MNLISIKFGGTSMGSAKSILECAKITKQKAAKHSVIVTVSAVAGVTNELFAMIELAKKQKPRKVTAKLIALKKLHKGILNEIIGDEDSATVWQNDFLPLFSKLETILVGTSLVGDTTDKTEANICSFGEKLSSHLMTYALKSLEVNCKRIESEKVIRTDSNYLEAKVNFKSTTEACRKTIKPLLTNTIIPVVTGFIGKDTHGNTTILGRGGSDYTASILAISCGATSIEIWTDVDGIMSADPKTIPNALSWHELDMQTVSEMAYSGAKVIHPKSIAAAIQKNIPVVILNTFNQKFAGTKVIKKHTIGVKGIIASKHHMIINLENPNMLEAVGFLRKITEIAYQNNIPIDVCATSETSFTFSIKKNDYTKKFHKDLSFIANIRVIDNASKLSIIGNDVTKNKILLATIFEIIAKCQIPIYTVSIGASQNNITILCDEINKDFLKLLHDKLIK